MAEDVRPLNSAERAVLQQVFGNTLDVDRIRIQTQVNLPGALLGQALPDTILMGVDRYDPKANAENSQMFRDTLIHEGTHERQYQKGDDPQLQGMLDRMGAKPGEDVYNYRPYLEEGRPYKEWPIEAQAQHPASLLYPPDRPIPTFTSGPGVSPDHLSGLTVPSAPAVSLVEPTTLAPYKAPMVGPALPPPPIAPAPQTMYPMPPPFAPETENFSQKKKKKRT